MSVIIECDCGRLHSKRRRCPSCADGEPVAISADGVSGTDVMLADEPLCVEGPQTPADEALIADDAIYSSTLAPAQDADTVRENETTRGA